MSKYRIVYTLIAAAVLSIIQISVIQNFSFTPYLSIVLIYVLSLMLSEKTLYAGLATFISGLFLDTFSSLPFGSHTIILAILLLGTYAGLQTFVSQRSILSLAGIAFLVSSAYIVGIHFIDYLSFVINQQIAPPFFTIHFLTWIIIFSFINTVCVLLVHRFMTRAKSFNLRPYMVKHQ